MDEDNFERLFDWIIAGYKEFPHLRPIHNGLNCLCGKPLEKKGTELGYCQSHNIECFTEFVEKVKIGAWSFAYLHQQLQLFASNYRDKINLQPRSESPTFEFPKIDNFTFMQEMDWRKPVIHPEESESSTEPTMCLPNYYDEDLPSPTILFKSLSQESFDFIDLMAE